MEIKIKENIDKGSIVLKHKIALETISILEEKDNTLATEVELYAMVATVDNFSEGSLLDLVTKDERGFAEIVENDIEPKFNEVMEKYEYGETFKLIVEDVNAYLTQQGKLRNTFIGLLNQMLDIINEKNWDDLKFFFNDVTQKAAGALSGAMAQPEAPAVKEKKLPDVVERGRKQNVAEVNEKMEALIAKFQQEGQRVKEEKEKEQKQVEESNE